MADQQQEHQRETEGLLDSIRELRKELQFETMLIDSFIPVEFQVRIHYILANYLIPYNCHTSIL